MYVVCVICVLTVSGTVRAGAAGTQVLGLDPILGTLRITYTYFGGVAQW